MIPGADNCSRSLLHRRVSSWSEVTSGAPQPEEFSLASSSSDDDDLSRPLLPALEYEEEVVEEDLLSFASIRRRYDWKLWIVFFLLVVSGVSNVVLAKLQSLPMYNYPTFLNIYASFLYTILSFLYILPASFFGWHSMPGKIPKKPFFIMGFLDAISAAMQVLATVYLPGTLLVLLPQAAIPLSMVASRVILREKFSMRQYLGAMTVMCGILVVLVPLGTHQHAPEYSCQAINEAQDCNICQMETTEGECLSHVQNEEQWLSSLLSFTNNTTTTDDDNNNNNNNNTTLYFCQWISRDDSLRKDDVLKFVWSLVMVASCLPMVLSSVYKQVALQDTPWNNPILVNGWVALFQFLCGIPLVIPAGLASSPQVLPMDLAQNWWRAILCLFAQENTIESGCHPDECFQGALWVHLGVLSSSVFTLSVLSVLKYGSSSLLYLGLTVIVPLGHLVFSLHTPLASIHLWDVAGLLVLVAGLVLYRFGHQETTSSSAANNNNTATSPASAANNNDDEGGAQIGDNNTINLADTDDKGGFLEFLREPFLLVGDI